MANYSSYKKVSNDRIVDGSIPSSAVTSGSFSNWCIKWFYGQTNVCNPGCCCNWSVPTGTTRMTIEAWGAGGNGHGECNCNRCGNWFGAGGGFYNTKTIDTNGGCQYTVCAGGTYRCCSRECVGCHGCSSYVNGHNLSGFCAFGGNRGCYTNSWSSSCFTQFERCCFQPGAMGGDFGMGNHSGASYRADGWNCHCFYNNDAMPTGAPFIGTLGVSYGVRRCWIRCGCWTVPYGHGGQGGITTYCGNGHCGQGATGGGGLDKITYF